MRACMCLSEWDCAAVHRWVLASEAPASTMDGVAAQAAAAGVRILGGLGEADRTGVYVTPNNTACLRTPGLQTVEVI